MSPVIAPPESLSAPTRNEPTTDDSAHELVVVHEGSSEFDFVDAGAPRRWTGHLASVAWALLGIAVFVALWHIATLRVTKVPSPVDTVDKLRSLLAHPFGRHAGTTGIGSQLLSSLGRVFKGFALAAIVGIPVGLWIGSSRRAWRVVNPLVQLLRPVSPLAWFPIWLVVFRNAPNAAIFVIFITALWPIVINTAAGAAAVPADHRNVAKVFRFNRRAYIRHVLIPDALPNIVTGLRTSMGIAWMVIVAVEMLSGGVGIGFYIWDAYNASNLSGVTAAIVLIGVVGLTLDAVFMKFSRMVADES
ncbi:MAG: nitrate ABC transporter permease [Actinobacteria bacterium]|nr:MAG: nitrate ABC transporter permease [Actinomycetota bacterium]